jgi:starch phosphorylase
MGAETQKTAVPPASPESDDVEKLRRQYGCGPVQFIGTDNALYERHLVFDNVVELMEAGPPGAF